MSGKKSSYVRRKLLKIGHSCPLKNVEVYKIKNAGVQENTDQNNSEYGHFLRSVNNY